MPTGSNLILGQSNTASDPTQLDIPGGTPSGLVVNYPGGRGFVGSQTLNAGLLGVGLRGVSGISLNDVGVGVAGLGSKVGVAGDSFGVNSVGVRGAADFMGVLGTASTAITTKLVTGVHGESLNRGGIGVSGQSATFFAVRGLAGRTPNSTAVGVIGIGKLGGHGVVGMAAAPGFAGAFFGDVSVDGNLAITGAKGAAVPFPDGSSRLLYAVESPESWFEDFGSARLIRGRATIKLDRGFRAVVRGPYHVFLSPEGECAGLYVGRKSAAGFEVREVQRGQSGIRFSYRIVARRKDVRAPRFAKIALPRQPRNADAPIDVPEPPRTHAAKEVRLAIGSKRSGRSRRLRRRG
jgi:hypothetical protein